MYRLRYKFIITLLSGGFLIGCRLAPPVKTPDATPLPSSFVKANDTTKSSGEIPWKKFFDDPYLLKFMEEGIANNLDLKVALQRIEQSRVSLRISKGMLLPSVGINAAAGQRKFGEYTMDGIGNFDTNFSTNLPGDKKVPEHLPDYSVGLQSSWEVFAWGKLQNQKKSAALKYLATEKGRQLIVTSLIAEIAKTYYDLIALDNELKIIRENSALQQTAVDLVSVQKEAGRATELAVKQFTAQLLNTKSLEAQKRQLVVQNENKLNFLLGRYPQLVERGNPILEQPLPVDMHAGVPSELLSRRPDIAQAELNLRAAKFDVDAARAAFLPSFVISSSLGLQSFRSEKLFSTPGAVAYSVFGGLTSPLFNRHLIRGNYKQVSAEQLSLFYEYQKLVINGYQETVTGLQRIENMRSAATFKQQEVNILREAVSTSNDLYLAGLASYLEVIMAQKNVLEAELQLAETRKEQFYSVIDLYRTLGGGW
ncbi:MAG: TolC family protein [Cyclobacteriaceae bacterium]|jgi:multidrug efflux system outer membrane protein|nr:TolC family protein [Flammeovirgaceae bacterium]